MNDLQLSDVQTINLQMLISISVGAERDLGGTCRKFAVHKRIAQRLREMPPEDMIAVVRGVGDNALFVPRDDCDRLLDAPGRLAAALATVHQPATEPPCA